MNEPDVCPLTMSSNDFFVAEEFLRQLKPIRQTADAGVIFETHVLEIELLMRQGKLSSAFDCIEKQVAEAKAADSAGKKIVHNAATGLADVWQISYGASSC
jgi:hypothetical protein